MITYKATNIVNGMWYVGSTNNFERRKKEHLRGNYRDRFHRELQKNPSNFVWVIINNDKLNTRDFEQKILNEHYGKRYCYNVSPNACGFDTETAKLCGRIGGKLGGKIAGNKRVSCIGNKGMKNLSLLAHKEKNIDGKSINALNAGIIASEKTRKPIKLTLIETGEICYYNSINEASKNKNLNRSCIWKVLTGKRKSAKGYYIEYADNKMIEKLFVESGQRDNTDTDPYEETTPEKVLEYVKSTVLATATV